MNKEWFPQEGSSENEKNSLSRRAFLGKVAATTGAGAIGYVTGQPLLETFEEVLDSESVMNELLEIISKLEEIWEITLDFSPWINEEAHVTSQELSLVEKRDLARTIVSCLELYPRTYIKSTPLETIKAIKHELQSATEDSEVFMPAVVNHRSPDTILFNTEPQWWKKWFRDVEGFNFGWNKDSIMRWVFHHEFYHIGGTHRLPEDVFNSQWERMHTDQGGSPYISSDDTQYPEEPGRGFISMYSTNNPREDRAEIASYLFTQPARIEDADEVLKMKIGLVKEEFYRLSNGIMDDFYWKLIGENNPEEIRRYIAMREKLLTTD